MGRDAEHNGLGGPDGWQALLEAPFWVGDEEPRVSLGHFGGESDAGGNDWTRRFGGLMGAKRGQKVYADLAYWEYLQCATVGQPECKEAEARLVSLLGTSIGGGETIADRVMYGSDWLMLSKEKNWPAYANQLFTALKDVAPQYVEKIFGGNAKRCFGSGLRFS